MPGDRTFATLDALLDQLLDLPPEGRPDYLARLTAEDPEKAAQLQRLLDRLEPAEDFLDASAESARDRLLVRSLETLHAMDASGDLQRGDKLGAYRIERVIGRGLRATIYLATREATDWSQRVAVKLMARGVNTDDVLRRFFAERQILTQLRYPGICTLLDGGVTDDGLPYFVMEYIDGVSITEYCQSESLGIDARVRLFRDVCEAVGQAHRHLVVHRDIKPANIMTTREGQVKLLDFGIAKFLQPEMAESAAITQMDVRPMTPAYSSPEQMAGDPITTATDVYQLGLLLAQMLTGVAAPREALGIEDGGRPGRELCRVDVPPDAALPYSAGALRGDLEWITLKCLEPRPTDRYGSAEELRADIERFLDQRPVLARRATLPYLAGKFVRRRPGLALAGVITLIATVVLISMLAYFNVNLARERSAAVTAADRAEEVKAVLVRFLSSADPYQGSGADTRVSDLLAQSEQVVTEELEHRPELQEELFGTLADVYANLSLPESSARLREKQLALLVDAKGPNAVEVLQARRQLAIASSRTETTEETLAALQAVLASLASLHPEQWLDRARTHQEIGNLLHVYGRSEDARVHAEQAVAILRERVSSPDDFAAALLLRGAVSQDNEERLAYHQEAADLLFVHRGPSYPATLSAMVSVASTLSDLARYEESLEIFDQVIPFLEQELGPLHQQTMTALNNRAVCLSRMGRDQAAIEAFQAVLDRDLQVHGSEHRDIANRLQNLGAMLNRAGRYPEAIEALTEAARIYGTVNLPGNPATAFPHITLADIHGKLGDVALLEHHARRALTLLDGNLPPDHHAILKCQCLLADAMLRQGQAQEGAALVEQTLVTLRQHETVNARLINECSQLLVTRS